MSATAIAKLEERTEGHAGILLAHGDRLTSLEKWRYGAMGALALVGFQIPILIALLTKFYGRANP